MQLKSERTLERSEQSKGYTLLELSIVIVIVSIVLVPIIRQYSIYEKERLRILTSERIAEASNEVLLYAATRASYPCPSDPMAGIGTANYGIDPCTVPATRAALSALAVGSCLAGTGICKVAGMRDADTVAGNDPILIGVVPFVSLSNARGKALGSEVIGVDGWNHFLLYAVSQNLTAIGDAGLNRTDVSQDFKYGVIKAVDEFGNDTAGIIDDAQFVILSHGDDGKGGYTINGVLHDTCSATSRDSENCDNDAVFMSSIANYEAAGANFYDDMALLTKNPSGELWAYIINPSTSASTGSIYNLNSGNIGVGTSNPQVKLDVEGDVRATTVLANTLCKADTAIASGTKCLPLNFFAGSAWTMPTGVTTPSGLSSYKNICASTSYDVMTGISSGQVQCALGVNMTTSPASPAAGPVNCPAGEYISAVLTNGCIICTGGGTLCP